MECFRTRRRGCLTALVATIVEWTQPSSQALPSFWTLLSKIQFWILDKQSSSCVTRIAQMVNKPCSFERGTFILLGDVKFIALRRFWGEILDSMSESISGKWLALLLPKAAHYSAPVHFRFALYMQPRSQFWDVCTTDLIDQWFVHTERWSDLWRFLTSQKFKKI